MWECTSFSPYNHIRIWWICYIGTILLLLFTAIVIWLLITNNFIFIFFSSHMVTFRYTTIPYDYLDKPWAFINEVFHLNTNSKYTNTICTCKPRLYQCLQWNDYWKSYFLYRYKKRKRSLRYRSSLICLSLCHYYDLYLNIYHHYLFFYISNLSRCWPHPL